MKIVFFALWFISLITWCIFAIRNETDKMHIEELRLDMQTVKKWINDIVKVVNNGNR